ARFKFGIVEQHVFDRAEGDGGDCCTDFMDAGRGGDEETGRKVDFFLRKTVEMETVHARDMVAQIVATLAAGAAAPAGASAIDGDELAGQEASHPLAEGLDLAGGFRADDKRHLALG